MAKRELRAIISADSRRFIRAMDKVRRTGAILAKAFAVGFAGVGAAAAFGIKKGFTLEAIEIQFETLLGSRGKAKRLIKDLTDFTAVTPFRLEQVAIAARQLEAFGGSALNTMPVLTTLGDATAAMGQDLASVAFWTGRVKVGLDTQSRAFGEAGLRLVEMSILSSQARQKMDEMAKAGVSTAKIMEFFFQTLKKSEGGMRRLSLTGLGLSSTFKDNVDLAMIAATESLHIFTKRGLSVANAQLRELLESDAPDRLSAVVSGLVKDLSGAEVGTFNLKDAVNGLADALTEMREDAVFKDLAESLTEVLQILTTLAKIPGGLFRGAKFATEVGISATGPAGEQVGSPLARLFVALRRIREAQEGRLPIPATLFPGQPATPRDIEFFRIGVEERRAKEVATKLAEDQLAETKKIAESNQIIADTVEE